MADQIREICRDPKVIAETVRQARVHADERIAELKSDLSRLTRQLQRDDNELRKLARDNDELAAARLADLHERIRGTEQRQAGIRDELTALERHQVGEAEVTAALSDFDSVWESLSPREQARVLRLLISRVEYDGANGEISIAFHPHGIKALAQQLAVANGEAA